MTSKAKARRAAPAEASETCLAPADHVAMLTADKDAAVAALEAERDAAKVQAFRLQTQLQLQQAEDALKEKRAHAQALAVARRDLAAQMAARYGVDWATTAVEPLSGRLEPLP